jgi:FXSXX-COOH protein
MSHPRSADVIDVRRTANVKGAAMEPAIDKPRPALVDLSAVQIADLRAIEGSHLARSMSRLLEEADRQHEAYAAFDSAL